jgi:hypothetical protein
MIEALESRQMMTATGIAEQSALDAPSAPPPVVVTEEKKPGGKLLATTLTNITNMRHEMLKAVAQNLRG